MSDLEQAAAPRGEPAADEAPAEEESVAFLRRSLTDLEEEWAAGDLDADDHARLRDEYTTRLARALRGERDGCGGRRRRSPGRAPAPAAGRRWLRPVALGPVRRRAGRGRRRAGGPLVGQPHLRPGADRRDPGGGRATGSTSASQLSQGADVVGAVKCYDVVLRDQPSSVEALTYRGWTLVRTGARRLLPTAVRQPRPGRVPRPVLCRRPGLPGRACAATWAGSTRPAPTWPPSTRSTRRQLDAPGLVDRRRRPTAASLRHDLGPRRDLARATGASTAVTQTSPPSSRDSSRRGSLAP